MRAKRLRYTLAALADFAEIHAYLAEEASVAIAKRVINRVREKVRHYREAPLTGVARPEYGAGCRFFRSGSYFVYYDLSDDDMVVLRVLHAARDRDRILREGA